jgi:hypothetical protein
MATNLAKNFLEHFNSTTAPVINPLPMPMMMPKPTGVSVPYFDPYTGQMKVNNPLMQNVILWFFIVLSDSNSNKI